MRLKQIKLAGFKSFVDPTTVTLPSNRCAVVGPNGCGKSNIIDAVRWVMGESSAKQLRGENITDVIFNGSGARKPTATASIELVFDNGDGRIGGEYSGYAEISVRRQVTRDAQSLYFLNGQKCRRRDILDIFLGTGFGPRSYSIIEQGMISQLVEAKPEELRVYLEEAAGISKYKERRRETENRIRHTRENLARLHDIREELGKQLDRLQRQARAAERYRELKGEESRLTAELYVLRSRSLAGQLAAEQERVAQLETELARASAEHQRLDTAIESARVEHAEESEAANRVQGEFYQLGADIARVEEAIQFSRERVKQLELDLETVQERSAETERQLELDNAQIQAQKLELADLGPRVREAEDADRLAAAALDELEARFRDWQSTWEAFSAEAAANDREAEVQSSRIEHLEQLLGRLRTRREQVERDAADTPSGADQEVAGLAQAIEAAEAARSRVEADAEQCLRELGAAREALLDAERALDVDRQEVQRLRHDLASLEAVQQAALGREERESQSWIEAQGLGRAARLGEDLAVVPGWERAVETVLGEYLQSILVSSIDDYRSALGNLLGGVTLYEARFESRTEGDLPSLESLVQSRDHKLGSLLQGVYAAESAEVALGHRDALRLGESIITRQGLWVGPDWVRMLPEAGSETGIIERAQEIDVLGGRVEEAESRLFGRQRLVAEARDRIEALEAGRDRLQATINEHNQQLATLKTDHGVRQVQQEEAEARQARLARERRELDAQIAEEAERLSTARRALAEAETRREAQATRREALAGERTEAEAALAAARETARASRDSFHGLNAEWQSLQSRLAAGETARERLLRQQEALVTQRTRLTEVIDSSTQPLPDLERELEQKLEERLAVESRLNAARRQLETLAERIRELDGERAAAEAAQSEVRDRLESARVARQGLSVQADNLREQIAATGHEAQTIEAGLPADAEESAWQESLERVDRRISRLGPINLAAIDEFEQQSERKVYLDQQNEDLEQALETLLTAIRKIDRETRQRFKETFEAVNERLKELFPKVFGGGHAYLELTGEDLLDTGVSLMARPPGKRNASVHLLSGGEKAMTAVALIFAIFHLNPSPVCLLDEVDAPLDDSNVTRFAELIKEMSTDVQFVVITHNKITMEMADQLMGVTMSEPGVSRLVSVDVEEAVALTA